MTRLPSDSFLPSGPLDSELHMSSNGLSSVSSSVISPLALPPGRLQYLDRPRPSVTSHPHGNTYTNHMYPQLNGNLPGPPQAQPANFLSPHLTPIPSQTQYQLQLQHQQQQQRSASMSPTMRTSSRRDPGMDRSRPTQSRAFSSGQQFRSPSVEPANNDAARVRRLESQCLKIKQAWENERLHMQADRNRAEEVYREDMALVEQERDEERAQWDAEKFELQSQIRQLIERLEVVEGRARNAPSLGGGAFGSQTGTYQGQLAERISPSQQPESSPFIPHDPNTYDSMAAIMEKEEPSVIVDVQEYHADLEGIPIKANAVKKTTFTDTPSPSDHGSSQSSGKSSPPSDPENPKQTAKERTMEVLKAAPNRRLTMNAGHTPTVSLSAVPSIVSSVISTVVDNTATSTGSNTPTFAGNDGSYSIDETPCKCSGQTGLTEPYPTHAIATLADHPEATMEPSEADPELKGPLMVRNIPAKDEIFFRRLSDKLEEVKNGEDAMPAVLRYEAESKLSVTDDISSSNDHGDSASNTEKEVEADIPLKLRRSNNFGAPLGSLCAGN